MKHKFGYYTMLLLLSLLILIPLFVAATDDYMNDARVTRYINHMSPVEVTHHTYAIPDAAYNHITDSLGDGAEDKAILLQYHLNKDRYNTMSDESYED